MGKREERANSARRREEAGMRDWDRVPQSEEGLSGESTGLPRGAPDYNLPFCLFAFKLW